MSPRKFIQKHKINLSDAEAKLCNDAMRMMRESLDVYHDESHIFRILGYLDEFMATEEYENITLSVDMKSLLIAILWHDAWKAGKDPKNIIEMIPVVMFEGTSASRKFCRAAEKAGLDGEVIQKIKYIIRKHSVCQLLPSATLEAKILVDIDSLDVFNLDRLYLIEKKYSCDRPFTRPTWRLARFALRILEPMMENKFSFNWMREESVKKKDIFIKKAQKGIDDYEEALRILESGNVLGFERYRTEWVAQNINRPEEEKPEDPF